jgi:hypothetical protein
MTKSSEKLKRKQFLSLLFILVSANLLGQSTFEKVTINVDLNSEIGAMRPLWAWFGYDEPNYTYMKDGKKLLSELAALSPVPVYVRAHNLLTSGDVVPALKWGSSNAYTEDAGFSFRAVIDSGVRTSRPDINAFAAKDKKNTTSNYIVL